MVEPILPDHQFRIDRGTVHGAIERRQLGAQPTQVENRVDPAHQVFGRDMVINMELVEELAPIARQRDVRFGS